ncbi:MAG: DUF3592 domain-containing protein [Chitinophagaceae bacterium]|nr:MAG: DUF3592 domain-containing protein [Chitinophagaceae bacterium]
MYSKTLSLSAGFFFFDFPRAQLELLFYLEQVNLFSQIMVCVFLFFTLASLIKEGRVFWRKLRVRLRGSSTMGTVTAARTAKESDSEKHYATVRFVTDSLRTIESESSESRFRKPTVGTEVKVFYDPDEPEFFFIENMWIWVLQVFGFASLIFICWQFYMLLRYGHLPWG